MKKDFLLMPLRCPVFVDLEQRKGDEQMGECPFPKLKRIQESFHYHLQL